MPKPEFSSEKNGGWCWQFILKISFLATPVKKRGKAFIYNPVVDKIIQYYQ